MRLIAGIGQIVLSWAPLGRSCVGLRKDITKRAQYHWLDTVMKCCHRPSCEHTLQQRLSLDVSELVGAFNELGPMLFETGYFDIKCLCDWLANHVGLSPHTECFCRVFIFYSKAPIELRRELVLRECSLPQLLENDMDRMFTALYRRQWGHYRSKMGNELSPLDLTVSSMA